MIGALVLAGISLVAAGAAVYYTVGTLQHQLDQSLRQNAALMAALLSVGEHHTASAVMAMASSEEYVGDALAKTPQASYQSEHPLGL